MGQNAVAVVVKEWWAVRAELGQLALTPELLDDARAAWSAAEASASPFEPVTAPGLKGWIAAVGIFRETLSMDADWEALDVACCPLMANKVKKLAICITSGDAQTGSPEENARPTTKNPKGLVLSDAVRLNGQQMELNFGARHPREINAKPRRARSAPLTWMMLVYTSPDLVMAELSLPAEIDAGGYIVRWHKRIVLPPMPRQSPPGVKLPEPDRGTGTPERDVPVMRG